MVLSTKDPPSTQNPLPASLNKRETGNDSPHSQPSGAPQGRCLVERRSRGIFSSRVDEAMRSDLPVQLPDSPRWEPAQDSSMVPIRDSALLHYPPLRDGKSHRPPSGVGTASPQQRLRVDASFHQFGVPFGKAVLRHRSASGMKGRSRKSVLVPKSLIRPMCRMRVRGLSRRRRGGFAEHDGEPTPQRVLTQEYQSVYSEKAR
jgi:hypothetical protein